jgi:hypothetical protein
MHGDWTVQIEDGTHRIHAEIIRGWWVSRLEITWDGERVASSPLWSRGRVAGSFQRDGHSFRIQVRRQGWRQALTLLADGTEVPAAEFLAHAVPVRPEVTLTLPPPPAVPSGVQFIKEIGVQDSEEIVSVEKYPLDNRFGDRPLSAVRRVSRESTNELSIDRSREIEGKFGINVLSAIKAEITAHVSRQTGQKIGERVSESQTLNFSVGPRSAVLYEVVWKRTVRSGEIVYLSRGNQVTIPYRINYGLSCEVRTQGQADGADSGR